MISKLKSGVGGAMFLLTAGTATAAWDWPAERERALYQRFSKEHSEAQSSKFDVKVDAVVPEDVQLFDMPDKFDYEPARQYRYVLREHRLYVVEPKTRKVVRIIERANP